MRYELQYKLKASDGWMFHSDYQTKYDAQDGLIKYWNYAYNWRISKKQLTPLERIEKRIKRIDLIILSVLFVVVFAIVYNLTQLL